MPEKTTIDIPFAGGIDTKTDPFQVQSGKLLSLQNGIFLQTGLIQRRWGYTALGMGIIGGGTIATTLAVTSFGNELLTYDGARAYSYIQSENAWATRGSMVPVTQSDKTIIAGNYQQLSPDHATLGGIDVYAWEDSRGGIRYSVFDTASGAVIAPDQLLTATSTAGRPKLLPLAAQSKILIIWDDGAGTLRFATISPTAPTVLSVLGFVIGGLITPCWYDACVASTGATSAFIVYNIVSGGFMNVRALALNAALTAATWGAGVFTYSGATGKRGLACFTDASLNCWVGWYNDTPAVEVAVLAAATGSAVLAPAVVASAAGVNATIALAGIVNGTTATLFGEVQLASGTQSYQHDTFVCTCTLAGAVTGPTVIGLGLGLASKPFAWNGQLYINCAFQTQMQPCYVCLAWGGSFPATIVARTLYGIGGGYLNNQDYMVPECPSVSAGVFTYANTAKGIPNTESGVVLSLLGVNATTLDFADSDYELSSAINGSLYTVGGILQRYDGHSYVEAGFIVWPEEVTFVPSTTGGAMAAGTYFYSVTYEYDDAFGFNEPSTPLPPVSVTVGGTGAASVAVTIPTLFLTNKTGVRLVVYRTTASGTLLYRVTSAILPTHNPYPSTATATTVFTDTLADASIQSNGLLYTQPLAQGNPILPNFAPPACTLIATYSNRLWVNTSDDPYTLFYSQQSIEGAPAQFCAALNLRIDPDGGAITAIARMDANLFIFKRNSIFYITGQGPDATGGQNDIGAPVQLPTGNIGCANANTIVLTPMGLLFQSNTGGIYLLDRSLNCTYKGAPVEAFTSPQGSALALTSAALIPNQWVVFTSTSGIALVYDYYYDQWSTFTGTPHAATDSAVYTGGGGSLALSGANGVVYVQSTSNSDAGFAIPFSLTTAWLKQGSMQGYQRVYQAYLLAQALIGTATITAHVDYDTTSTPITGTITQASPPSGPANYQWRLDILKKCEAIQLTVAITQTPGTAPYSLSGFSLIVGAKRGGNKNLPTTRQTGVS